MKLLWVIPYLSIVHCISVNSRLGRFEAIPDNLSPEEILAQAKAAAKDAADMLTLREPKSRVCIRNQRQG